MKRLLILLLIASSVSAQTKFYLNNFGSTGQHTTIATWNVTTGNVFYGMHPRKSGTTIASRTTSATGAAAVRYVIMYTFQTPPLAAQTLNGSITGQIRMNMSSTTSRTGQGYIFWRVLNANGTVASELDVATTTNLTTTLTNRTQPSTNIDWNVSITAGQRLCAEIGWKYLTGTTTTTTGTGSFGSSAATDLAADNTTTTANTPWLQFSQTLTFLKIADKHFF